MNGHGHKLEKRGLSINEKNDCGEQKEKMISRYVSTPNGIEIIDVPESEILKEFHINEAKHLGVRNRGSASINSFLAVEKQKTKSHQPSKVKSNSIKFKNKKSSKYNKNNKESEGDEGKKRFLNLMTGVKKKNERIDDMKTKPSDFELSSKQEDLTLKNILKLDTIMNNKTPSNSVRKVFLSDTTNINAEISHNEHKQNKVINKANIYLKNLSKSMQKSGSIIRKKKPNNTKVTKEPLKSIKNNIQKNKVYNKDVENFDNKDDSDSSFTEIDLINLEDFHDSEEMNLFLEEKKKVDFVNNDEINNYIKKLEIKDNPNNKTSKLSVTTFDNDSVFNSPCDKFSDCESGLTIVVKKKPHDLAVIKLDYKPVKSVLKRITPVNINDSSPVYDDANMALKSLTTAKNTKLNSRSSSFYQKHSHSKSHNFVGEFKSNYLGYKNPNTNRRNLSFSCDRALISSNKTANNSNQITCECLSNSFHTLKSDPLCVGLSDKERIINLYNKAKSRPSSFSKPLPINLLTKKFEIEKSFISNNKKLLKRSSSLNSKTFIKKVITNFQKK